MAEGVTGLAFGHRTEQGGDVGVALDVGLLGEVEVAAVGLALACERLFQVALGLGSLQMRARCFLPCSRLGVRLRSFEIPLRERRSARPSAGGDASPAPGGGARSYDPMAALLTPAPEDHFGLAHFEALVGPEGTETR